MKKLIISDIIKNAKLFLGTLIAIVITVAIVSSCLSLVFSAREQADYGRRFEGVNVVVAPRDSIIIQYQTRDSIQQDEKELEAKPPFDAEQLFYLTSNYSCVLDYTFFTRAEQLKYGKLAGHNESSMALSTFTIIEGKSPQTNEVLIDKELAAGNKITIGDAISIKTNRGTSDYIVSGIVDSNISGIYNQQNYIFFKESTAIAMSNGCLNVGIVADDVMDLSESLKQKGFRVYTEKTINYGEAPEMTDENTALLIIFFTMGALCLVISMVVISGTIKFGIKHRLRNLALLRVLGFTKEQIKRLLSIQSGMLCMIGGILGVLLSFPLADFIIDSFIRIGIADKDFMVFHTLLIDGIAIAVTLIVVLIVTAITANKPLSISPISAIKDEGEQEAKSTKAGIVAGAAFSLGGVVMLILASFNGRNGIAMSFLTSCLFLTGAILFSPAVMRLINWLMSAITRKMDNSLGQVANANIKLKATRFAVASISIAIMMSLNGVMMLNDMTYLKSNAQTKYEMAQDLKYVAQNVSQREIKVKDYLGMKNIRMIIRNINHLDGIYGLAVNNIAMMNIQLLYGEKNVEPGQIMLSQNARGFSVGQEVEVWFPDGYKAVLMVSGIFVSDSDKTEETVDCIIHDDLALNHTFSNEYDLVYYNEQINGSIENTFEYYTNNANYDVQMGASLLLVGISIVLSIIALYNTFAIIMSVRRKEFNGLKVIGASKGQIVKMTLIETLIVVGTGMAIGLCIIIPVVGKFAVDNLGVFDFIINRQIFIGMCLASAALGLTAGMIPSFLTIFRLKQQFRNE